MRLVKVCDAIMGSGKSSAAIAYMNENKDKKFIYITPYLDEAARIRKGCPDLHFIEPSNHLQEYGFKKLLHTAALIKEGRNITTTHQAFKRYTDETLASIREQEYTLIVDENVDTLEEVDVSPDDIDLLVSGGYLSEENGHYKKTDKIYTGKCLTDVYNLFDQKDILRVSDANIQSVFYWEIPIQLFLAFNDVIILTYMFEGQSLHHFLEIYKVPFRYVGVAHDVDTGSYRFTDAADIQMPEFVRHIRDKVHIVDNKRMNEVGERRTALSMNWFGTDAAGVEQLKNNIMNCFLNIWRDAPKEKRLWSCYNSARSQLAGKGYTKAFLIFNAKATNEYKDRDHLVYAANVFMSVPIKRLYRSYGIDVNEDMYALSVMVQWIWRSAIRDGKDIWVYIPSRRMRELLTDWMDRLSAGEKV